MASEYQPVHPLRQRWEAEHFPHTASDGQARDEAPPHIHFDAYGQVTAPRQHQHRSQHQDHQHRSLASPESRYSRSDAGVAGSDAPSLPHGAQGHGHFDNHFGAYGQVTTPSAHTSPYEHQDQPLEDHRERPHRRTTSYGSSRSQSERGVTELDAPPPLGGDRQHGYLEDRQSSDRASSSRRSGQRERRASLSEMAAPAPVDERKPPSDEETATGSQEDFEARRESEKDEPATPEHSSFLTELYTVSWLIFFSFWGTLARLGVEAITLYPNSPFPSRVLWANLGGSFAMGFLVEDRRLFRDEWGDGDPKAESSAHLKVKKTLPLYIGLSTGFCGCFTSFSSFMRDAFLALTNDLQSPSPVQPYQVNDIVQSRNGGFSFLALIAILIVHSAVSLGSLKAGAHFALLVQPATPALPFRFFRSVVDPLAVILAFGCWLGSIFLSIWPPGNDTHWRFRATLSLVFAPLGCLLRFYASKHLNARIPSFPLGTFAANIFGTAILGMAWDLQHASGIGAGAGVANACSVLEGVMEGFCGCLSTVSTWVLELDGLRRRHAWFYGFTSVGVGLGVMVTIMGSMGWTIGFTAPSCS